MSMPKNPLQRPDGRSAEEVRPMAFERGFLRRGPGNCLVSLGETRVLCTVSVEEGVPPWMAGRGRGWLTAEYGMLPGSTDRRKPRDGHGGKVDGRTIEIQRLIGRALRTCLDLERTGERTFQIDCDVIEADGGTRVASINGACLALWDACDHLMERGKLKVSPFRGPLGAISIGIHGDQVLTDLCYEEDSAADADINVVMDQVGGIVEFQASSEGRVMSGVQLRQAIDQAAQACDVVLRALSKAKGMPIVP